MIDDFDRAVAKIHRRVLISKLFSTVLLVALALLLWWLVGKM